MWSLSNGLRRETGFKAVNQQRDKSQSLSRWIKVTALPGLLVRMKRGKQKNKQEENVFYAKAQRST